MAHAELLVRQAGGLQSNGQAEAASVKHAWILEGSPGVLVAAIRCLGPVIIQWTVYPQHSGDPISLHWMDYKEMSITLHYLYQAGYRSMRLHGLDLS